MNNCVIWRLNPSFIISELPVSSLKSIPDTFSCKNMCLSTSSYNIFSFFCITFAL